MAEKEKEEEAEIEFKNILRGLEKSKLPIEESEKTENESSSKGDKEGN